MAAGESRYNPAGREWWIEALRRPARLLCSAMSNWCPSDRCKTPRWMGLVVLAAGLYQITFAVWTNLWPHLGFDWCGLPRPNHPMLWRGVGLLSGCLGLGMVLAARDPIHHWLMVLIGMLKFLIVGGIGLMALWAQSLPLHAWWMVAVDNAIWIPPFFLILYRTARAQIGIPLTGDAPLTIAQAAREYQLSSGESLLAASSRETLALVFLRHFGCTFTRQIVRSLETLKEESDRCGTRLVLVHMLQRGKEIGYIGQRGRVERIADPRCELYRAFGLGKGGFLELFGPKVWLRGAISILKGCGVGHLAGDGLQMPGAFLFRDGKIIAAKPAASAADLPDLQRLIRDLPAGTPVASPRPFPRAS